jgi:hypothetical protein
MSKGIYVVGFGGTAGVAVTAIQDLFEIVAASSTALIIHQVQLAQITEIADAQEEMLSLSYKRGTSGTTSGSGGSAPTPVKLETGMAAASSTAEVNNTTIAVVGGGTLTVMWMDSWNVRQQYLWLPTPELRPVISPGERFILTLNAAPADSITMAGNVWFEEFGG